MATASDLKLNSSGISLKKDLSNSGLDASKKVQKYHAIIPLRTPYLNVKNKQTRWVKEAQILINLKYNNPHCLLPR